MGTETDFGYEENTSYFDETFISSEISPNDKSESAKRCKDWRAKQDRDLLRSKDRERKQNASLTMSEAEKNELRRKNNESQKRRREKKRIAMLAENLISDSMTENPILFKEESSETDYEYRGVVPGLAEGAMAPSDFGTSVNPISAKGGRLYPPYNTGTP